MESGGIKMNIHHRLNKLFTKDFHAKDLTKKVAVKTFSCPLITICKVNLKKESCFTPYLGNVGTKIMLVAEAPSVKRKNVGAHVAGLFENTENKSLNSIRNFVEKYFNTTPYFTDLMKCGVRKQTREEKKKIFGIRTEKCMKHYLLKEIKILQPEIILCLGYLAYTKLKEAKKNGKIDNHIKLRKLLHYGTQASWSLNAEDKLNYIWPLQLGKIPDAKLSNLSYFKKLKNE